jgi:hypothetical protein
MADGPRFGEQPLPQTVAAAAAIRRLTSLLSSLEHAHPTVDEMLARFAEWETDLSADVPPDPTPRIGEDPDGARRLYLQHALDIGGFNPCFPTYEFYQLESESAAGSVTFPVAYEGPPGMVHGGFLGVFFDCVVQHHNCELGLAGKTASLRLTYRRPTPLLTDLTFVLDRSVSNDRIRTFGSLSAGDKVLCQAEVDAFAGVRSNLPEVSPRRAVTA